jgi:hypothetical protein
VHIHYRSVVAVGAEAVRIVGSVLVRNEDVFVERAVRNAAAFCDRIHAVDHQSSDRTWEILRGLASELDHLDVRRAAHAGESHRLLERYAGTRTWVIGVDGDELFDPFGLAVLREALLGGAHADVFRLKAHVLNCDELDGATGEARGWMAPPSRPVTKLFNFAAVEAWSGCPERLHSGTVVFRQGYDWESRRNLFDELRWEADPLRCLHVCFRRRSSRDAESEARPSLGQTGAYDRGPLGVLKRRLGRAGLPPKMVELNRSGRTWKQEWYARGPRVSVDATPFLAR